MVKKSKKSKTRPLKIIKKADRLENSAKPKAKLMGSPKIIIKANGVEIWLGVNWSIKVNGLECADKLDLQTLREVCVVAIEQKIIPYDEYRQNGKKMQKAIEAAFRTVVAAIHDNESIGIVAHKVSKQGKLRG